MTMVTKHGKRLLNFFGNFFVTVSEIRSFLKQYALNSGWLMRQ
jgi:hypothetical protein